jgi:hypothetical protein
MRVPKSAAYPGWETQCSGRTHRRVDRSAHAQRASSPPPKPVELSSARSHSPPHPVLKNDAQASYLPAELARLNKQHLARRRLSLRLHHRASGCLAAQPPLLLSRAYRSARAPLIQVGGGTAGCVLASRLSLLEGSPKVLLLERGEAIRGWTAGVPLLSTAWQMDEGAASLLLLPALRRVPTGS